MTAIACADAAATFPGHVLAGHGRASPLSIVFPFPTAPGRAVSNVLAGHQDCTQAEQPLALQART
jgi:hypothetical protein